MTSAHHQLMLLVFGLIGSVAAYVYVLGWQHASRLLAWRRSQSEQGETSLSVIIVAVALIAAITVLVALDKAVPTVLSQGLASILFGIVGGELAMRRGEIKKGTAVHPRRAKPRTPPRP